MPSMSGKQALAQMLVAEGVEYIFGNPGTSETPFLDVLQDYPQMRYIQALQEGTAVGMADGYARACHDLSGLIRQAIAPEANHCEPVSGTNIPTTID